MRLGQAKQAKKDLKVFLLDAAHESHAKPKDYMSLPTRLVYVYEAIVKSTTDQIKEVVLKRIGQPYKIEKRQVGQTNATRTLITTDKGADLPADVTKLLALLNGWPGAGRQTSRPRFFLGFLQQIQEDATFKAFRNKLNKSQFGFDDALMSDMAIAQPV